MPNANPPQNPGQDRTSPEAAKRMGLTTGTVRDLIGNCKFPNAYKVGDLWFIPQSDIDAFLQDRSNDPAFDAPSKWARFKSHPYVFWPMLLGSGIVAILLFIFAVISAGADLGPFQEQLNHRGLFPTFSNATQNETLILITEFDVTQGNRDLIIYVTLRDALEAKIKGLALENAPRVEITPEIIKANLRPNEKRARAQEIGQKHNATLIIWGSDTGAKIEVNFLNLKEPEFDAADVQITEVERTQLASPEPLSTFLFDDLPSQINFLAFFALGQSYYQQADFTQAIVLIEEAIVSIFEPTKLPDKFDLDAAYFRLGWLHQNINNIAQAIANYDHAIALNPQDAAIYNNRGVAYKALGDLNAAIANYEQAITLNPQYAAAYYNRGLVYYDQDDLTAAIANFDQAITLNPQDADAFYNRGTAYYYQGDLTQAIVDFDQAIALNHQYAVAYNNRGNAYYDQGDLTQAIADFDQAIALNHQYADAFYNRGIAYADQGDLAQAIADFQHYLELQPNASNRVQIEEFIQSMEKELEQ